MTYQSDPVRTGNSVLKFLVVAAIVFVSYWAISGGYDSVAVPDPTPSTSTTSTTLAG